MVESLCAVPKNKIMNLRVAADESELRNRVKAAGGQMESQRAGLAAALPRDRRFRIDRKNCGLNEDRYLAIFGSNF